MNDTVIVTGSGFLSTKLAEHLRNKGLDVHAVGRSAEIRCDLTNYDKLATIITKIAPDTVFHCAGCSDPRVNHLEPDLVIRDNVLAVQVLLETLKEGTRLIHVSSAAVYGNQIFPNEVSNFKPNNLYGLSKVMGETFVGYYTEQKKLKTTIIRPVSIVGHGSTHGMVHDFRFKIRTNPKLNIMGEFPGPTKPYIHVSDVVKWMVDCPTGVFNLSNNGVSAYSVARAMTDKPIIFGQKNDYNTEYVFVPNDCLARSKGWNPMESLKAVTYND